MAVTAECPYCFRVINVQKFELHTKGCYQNDLNMLKIAHFLRDYTHQKSNMRRVVLYPQIRDWNKFATRANILHLRAGIQSFDPEIPFEGMIDTILIQGIRNNVIQYEDYPPYLRYVASFRQYYTPQEWLHRFERVDEVEKKIYGY